MTNSSIGSTNFVPSLRQIGSPVEVERHPNRKPCQDCGTSTSTALTSCTCRMLPSRTKLAFLKFNGTTNSLPAWCKLGKPSCEPIVHPCWKRRPNESKGDETASDKYPSSRKTNRCPSTVSTMNENSWAPDVLITLPWQSRNSPELRTGFPQKACFDGIIVASLPESTMIETSSESNNSETARTVTGSKWSCSAGGKMLNEGKQQERLKLEGSQHVSKQAGPCTRRESTVTTSYMSKSIPPKEAHEIFSCTLSVRKVLLHKHVVEQVEQSQTSRSHSQNESNVQASTHGSIKSIPSRKSWFGKSSGCIYSSRKSSWLISKNTARTSRFNESNCKSAARMSNTTGCCTRRTFWEIEEGNCCEFSCAVASLVLETPASPFPSSTLRTWLCVPQPPFPFAFQQSRARCPVLPQM